MLKASAADPERRWLDLVPTLIVISLAFLAVPAFGVGLVAVIYHAVRTGLVSP